MYSLGLVNNHCEIFSENPQVKSQLFTLQMWCAASGGVSVTGKHFQFHLCVCMMCPGQEQPWTVPAPEHIACTGSLSEWLPCWGCDGVSASPVLPVRMCRRYWLSVLPGNSHFSICTLCLFAECPICSSKYTWNSWYTQRLHCIKRTLIHNL